MGEHVCRLAIAERHIARCDFEVGLTAPALDADQDRLSRVDQQGGVALGADHGHPLLGGVRGLLWQQIAKRIALCDRARAAFVTNRDEPLHAERGLGAGRPRGGGALVSSAARLPGPRLRVAGQALVLLDGLDERERLQYYLAEAVPRFQRCDLLGQLPDSVVGFEVRRGVGVLAQPRRGRAQVLQLRLQCRDLGLLGCEVFQLLAVRAEKGCHNCGLRGVRAPVPRASRLCSGGSL